MRPLDRVAGLCRRLGVRVKRRMPDDPIPLSVRCPFSADLGIEWETRVLHVCDRKGLMVGACVHEIGHIVAVREAPDDVDEETCFVAWEWLTARRLGITREWIVSMDEYGIGGRTSVVFGELARAEQLAWLRERVRDGERYGNIVNGRPVRVR